MVLKFLRLFLVLFPFGLLSQDLPPIQKIPPAQYFGENQNWAISQASNKFIYAANNHGLLEFDGVRWNRYPSPNGSVIREVLVSDDIIYTGCYREFGFWRKKGSGNLEYTSLSVKLREPLLVDEEFWNIIAIEDWVLFQSLNRIYVYNRSADTFRIIEAETNKAQIFDLTSGIYFQRKNQGIYKVEGMESVLITDDPRISTKNLIGLFESESGLIYLTDDAKFYRTNDVGRIIPWDIANNDELASLNLYSSLQLKDGRFVLGTISDGMYLLSKDGKLIYEIDQQNGLNNNTVLAIFEDNDANVWLGHDNGMSVVNLMSPFMEYIDNAGKLGVVYASKTFDGYLYLGTNQGLFYTKLGANEEFRLISGTQGQVWRLTEIQGTLFCGHNSGTYTVYKDKAQLIADFPGTWNIKPFPNNEDYLLQGNYNGLSVLEKRNGRWQYGNKVGGFDISSRFFEFSEDGEIWVNHEYKGVFQLKIDNDFQNVELLSEDVGKGHTSSLVKFEEDIIYATYNGIFKLDAQNKEFVTDTTLNGLFPLESRELLSILIVDKESDRLWRYADQGLMYATTGRFDELPRIVRIVVPSFLRSNLGVSGFENLSLIEDAKYLIGTSNGYVTLDLDKIKPEPYQVHLSAVSKEFYDAPLEMMPLDTLAEYHHFENNLRFSYGVPEYSKYTEVRYQYKLEGLHNHWSTWSPTPEVSFENLPFGEYEFKVRAKVGGVLTDNIATYAFKINTPWYWSTLAIICYGIALILLSYLIHRMYRSYYKKQQLRLLVENKRKLKRKKIKSQKKIIQIKNEKLRNEIESKNRELAVSTMSLIKKNEFLNAIKDQLNKTENPGQIKSVIRTIDRNINNEDDWKFFEQAFNNADKHFLKKIKETHPDLTANDLRLCAYLRLNLSSKEIAPLLNISVRSVEVKRYRLRKKMDLPHENNLVEYILQI